MGPDLRVKLALDVLSGASGDERASALQNAAAHLTDLQSAGARAPDAGSARISLALMQPNAGVAYNAWRDYFWLTGTDTPEAMPGLRRTRASDVCCGDAAFVAESWRATLGQATHRGLQGAER